MKWEAEALAYLMELAAELLLTQAQHEGLAERAEAMANREHKRIVRVADVRAAFLVSDFEPK